MPYREVTMMEVKEVLLLWLAETPKQRIAAMLGLDRKTVRRYIDLAAAHGLKPDAGAQVLTDERLEPILVALRAGTGRPHGEGWALCSAHRAFLEEKLKRERLKLTKVHRLLARQGVQIPYATLHRFAVAELSWGRRAPTIPVADCEGGQEVQLDTGWVGRLEVDLFGKRRRFRAWIFTAVRSRHRFVWPCFRETTHEAILACEAAWQAFGGIFRVLIPDNTKAIVQRADSLGAVINTTFLEYAQARGFHVDAARSHTPTDKARVERGVQPVRDDCFAGERLQTLEDALRRAVYWCEQEYGSRLHSTTRRRPLEHFEAEEKPHLLPAPLEAYDVPLWCEPKVGRDQLAQVNRAFYSLPHAYVGKVVRARADRSTARFYHGAVLIKTHARVPPGQRAIDPADYPQEKTAYAMRDVDFLKRRAESHGPHIGQLAAILLEGPLPWTRMRRVYALLSLVRKYGDRRVEEVCATALTFEMNDVRRIQRMLQNGTSLPPLAAPEASKVIPLARYLRPASQYSLPLSDPNPKGETP